jgi:GT2 family glycosyltransferase
MDVVYAYYNDDPNDARFFASNNFAMAADQFRLIGGFNPNFRTSEDREFCDRWRSRGLRISYAPEAVIHHAHPLTLRSLWKQHFGYGRGAWRFHQARASRGAEPFRPDLTFYFKLLRASCSQAGSAALLMPAWLLWSQVANTAGFFYERIYGEEPTPKTEASK